MHKKEYQAYHDAKQRCINVNHPRYKEWGGRGICFQLPSFPEFFKHLGPKPDGYSLDRVDNNLHYSLDNIRWASREQQQLNKRVSKHNTLGITGVRVVKAKGVVNVIYQAYVNMNKQFIQLYTGTDFFEACCARKACNG